MSTSTSSTSMSTEGSSPVRIQIGRAQDVQSQGRKAEAPNASIEVSGPTTHGMSVSSQVEVGQIKIVDRRTVEGSYNGQTDKVQYGNKDVVSTDFAKNSPAPREGMTEAKMRSSKLDTPKPSVTVTDETEPNSEVE